MSNVIAFLLLSALPGADVPRHQVAGQVAGFSPIGEYLPLKEHSSYSQGVSPSVAKTFAHPLATGSYSASASYVNGLPRFSLSAESKQLPVGGAGDISADYFGAQAIVVSGFGAAAPTKLAMLWTMSGGVTGPTDVSIQGYDLGYFPKAGTSSPNFVADVVKTNVANGFTFSGHGVATHALTAVGDVVYANFGIWAYAANFYGEGSGFLDMVAESLTFPEFGDQTAEQLGWTVTFGDRPTANPDSGGGGTEGTGGPGSGGQSTPEPTSMLIFASLFGVAALRRRVIA